MKKKAFVLVAEDNDADFAVIEKNLQRNGYPSEIIRFCDGQKLLNALSQIQEAETVFCRPYLLFVDIQLPQVDGLEVLGTIKANPQLKKIPVIVLLTSENEQQVLEQCYRYGCSFCLRKPDIPEHFSEMFRHVSDFLSVMELPELPVPEAMGAVL
ncbi:MAG TPA: response regulator [Anaerohalosphaeraceae bacterium]|nr:response regulator [Anaerohalosphaeraceae bacterium]HOL88643.1 response regulator [Anaerohalosphaeraceae bacterium]